MRFFCESAQESQMSRSTDPESTASPFGVCYEAEESGEWYGGILFRSDDQTR